MRIFVSDTIWGIWFEARKIDENEKSPHQDKSYRKHK
jgi:hypothetical protein